MFDNRSGYILTVALVLGCVQVAPALAQSKFQTPSGHQTVAPSDMPQQPMLEQDLQNKAKVSGKTIPSPVLDQPGVQSLQPPNSALRTGQSGIVLPQGETSSVRIGPMEPTPIWARAILGVLLFAQFLCMAIIGLALQVNKTRDEEELQSGALISQRPQEESRGPLRGAA